jgi:hypothetical protein
MQLSAALRERDREDFDRIERASVNPNRRGYPDPLDARLECPLGRLRVIGAMEERRGCKIKNGISEPEYQAGVKWRVVYGAYLQSIQSPEEMTEDDCNMALKAFERGLKLLQGEGKRILHALNAIAVFEEPEELGDFEFTSNAARVGLTILASRGF